jgi:hypothetical protein
LLSGTLSEAKLHNRSASETKGLALCLRPLTALGQKQEPGSARCGVVRNCCCEVSTPRGRVEVSAAPLLPKLAIACVLHLRVNEDTA